MASRKLLYDQLSHAIADSGFAYLLVDPYLVEPPTTLLKDVRTEDIVSVPVRHAAVASDQCPRLIRVNSRDVDLIHDGLDIALVEQSDCLMESERGFVISGWLFSAASINSLAHHIAQSSVLWSTIKKKRLYFRWADRRVFEWMWPHLDLSEQAQLLGPIESRWQVTRSNTWARYDRQSAPAETVFARQRFIADAAAWQRAMQCESVQAMLRGWRSFSDSLPDTYLKDAASAVADARSLGLRDQRDINAFGAYQLQVHAQLALHPRVKAIVSEALDRGQPIADAMSQLDTDEQWDAIQRDLDGRESARA